MADLDSTFELVARELTDRLNELDPGASATKRWVLIDDQLGVEFSAVDFEMARHELLASFIDQGATSAAYVTYRQ